MPNFLKILVAFLGATTCVAIAAPTGLFKQTVSVSGTSANVDIAPTAQGTGYIVTAVFRTSGGAVRAACLSAYRDLIYVLHDSTGHIVPINQNAVNNPPGSESHDYFSVSTRRSPGVSCEKSADRQAVRLARLDALYPHVGPGTYILQIYLAPRGLTQRAAFTPIEVTVDSQHPL